MAVTITDLRTLVSDADSLTGWTGSATPTLFTTDPDPAELTGCIGMAVSTATQHIYFTMGASVNFSTGTRVYVWVRPNGAMDTTANGGVAILLGDGTNRVGFHLAGSDKAGFRHNSGPVTWQCLVLDTGNLPAASTNYAGTRASLNMAAITQIGAGFKTLAKSTGGVSNCWIDAIRYGNGGLRVTGGSSGDPGTWAQIAAADRATTSGAAYGIVRELQAGVYGIQGDITFGDDAGTSTFYFKDSSATVIVEDTIVGTGTPTDINIKVVGNSTAATQHFELGVAVGTGDTQSGRNGVNFINANTTQPALFDASDADLDNLYLYGCQFNGFSKAATLTPRFSNDATNGVNHRISGCTFARCGQVDVGRVLTRNTIFSGYTQNVDAALLWNDNINIKNCQFLANTDGTNNPAAIEHPSATGSPFTYDNMKFSGNDFDINNTSGSSITINATNGSDPGTSTGSSVTINNAVTLTVTCKNEAGLAVQGVRVRIESTAGVLVAQGTTDVTGVFTTSYNFAGNLDVNAIARLKGYKNSAAVGTITSAGFTQGFTLIRDPAVNLP